MKVNTELTPAELLENNYFLRIEEVMLCLQVSRNNAYLLGAMGTLNRHYSRPWRVTSKSVKKEMVRRGLMEFSDDGFDLSPDELLAKKPLLRINEVRYCLRISRSTAYRLVEEGILVKHNRLPLRITAASVKAEMENVEIGV